MSSLSLLKSHSEHWRSLQPSTTNRRAGTETFLLPFPSQTPMEKLPCPPSGVSKMWPANWTSIPTLAATVQYSSVLWFTHWGGINKGWAGSLPSILTQGQWDGQRWYKLVPCFSWGDGNRVRRQLNFQPYLAATKRNKWEKAVLELHSSIPQYWCPSRELKFYPHQAPIRWLIQIDPQLSHGA